MKVTRTEAGLTIIEMKDTIVLTNNGPGILLEGIARYTTITKNIRIYPQPTSINNKLRLGYKLIKWVFTGKLPTL